MRCVCQRVAGCSSRLSLFTFVALTSSTEAHRLAPSGIPLSDGSSASPHVNSSSSRSVRKRNSLAPEALLQAPSEGEDDQISHPFIEDGNGKKYVYSRKYARAKYANFWKVRDRYSDFYKYLRLNKAAGQSAYLALIVAAIGPFVLYAGPLYILSQLRPSLQEWFPMHHPEIEKLARYFSFSMCVAGAFQTAVRCIMFQGKERWIQVEIEECLTMVVYLLIGYAMSSSIRFVDKIIQLHFKRNVDDDYLWRHEFMATISSPTNVEPLPVDCETLEESILKMAWFPFYISTQAAIWTLTILTVFGFEISWYIVASLYFLMAVLSAVFGARTLGPDLYGGVVILLEKPFEIGDIISIEWKGGPGGCTDTLATGFVEKMSLRSTTLRRFDMRSCTVPNSWCTKYQVSNWKRPRKLINLDVGISHNTPLEVVKRFSHEAKQIIKNHPEIDQQLYTKAVFNKLSQGFIFRVVCFNAVGTKKQNVQQDLLYRISALARQLGIVITFGEQSLTIQKQELSNGHYLPPQDMSVDLDLSDIVPTSSADTIQQPKMAPESYILVRIEEAAGLDKLVRQVDGYVFLKVSYGSVSNCEQHQSTSLEIVYGDMINVKWFQTLVFHCGARLTVQSYAKLELCAVGKKTMQQYFRKAQVLAHTFVDLSLYASRNLEPSWVVMSPDESLSEVGAADVRVSLRVFVAPNIRFPSRDSTVQSTASVESETMLTPLPDKNPARGRLSNADNFAEALRLEMARPKLITPSQSGSVESRSLSKDSFRRDMSFAARGSDDDVDPNEMASRSWKLESRMRAIEMHKQHMSFIAE